MQIDIKEAASLFNISEREMLRWIERRGVPAHSVQDHFMFNRAELVDWAHAQGIVIEKPMSESGIEQLPSLSEALISGGICRIKGGGSREEVLRELVGVMPLPPKTDREGLFKVLLAREMLSSTGIGDGIAIPHVRSPLILNTEEPLVNLCLLETPVDFAALDTKPVHALFTMIAPNARLHLHLISRLALVLHNVSIRELLEKKVQDSEIIEAIAKIEADLAKRHG